MIGIPRPRATSRFRRSIASVEVSNYGTGEQSPLPAYLDENWAEWLLSMFPNYFLLSDGRPDFAQFHRELWGWVFSITQERPNPFVALWPRDTGKSTNAEIAACYLACEGVRRYCLYVSGTQSQADDHVANVAALFESESIERRYPQHGERMVGKFNQSRGWRVNRIRTAGGFTCDAIGLDQAVRGARLEMERPDLIIFDDIDQKHDTPRAVNKKIEKITTNILPAGNRDKVATLFVQNVIHDGSVAAKLADGTADMLNDRFLSGPHPAINDLTYEIKGGRYILTGGTPSWRGLSIETCQQIVSDAGWTAFQKEYQQIRSKGRGALWTPELIEQTRVERAPIGMSQVVVAIDPQVSSSAQGSQTGIVVAGLHQGHAYIMRDQSDFYSPAEWAETSLDLYDRYRAGLIIGERNNGGDLVEANIRNARPSVNFRSVWASRGKYIRAEPVVALYERGLVHHVGKLAMLEDQMTEPYDPNSDELTWDRLDALVWALTAILIEPEGDPNFDAKENVYTPRDYSQRDYQDVTEERVREWSEDIRQGVVPTCKPGEYGTLRTILIDYIERFAERRDVRGQVALETLKMLDARFQEGLEA